jgi:NAD(P)-dependent dehydrogenase (short-subunit alcohol dehydrogenase family)
MNPPDRPLTGKTCLLTGATGGLGRATALAFAERGASLVLACRDPGRGAAVRAEILARHPASAVELLAIDLASPDSIRAGVTAFLIRHDRLDLLINNAARFVRRRVVSPGGLELMFATNHLGPFLLTYYLLDTLKASAPARVLTIAAPSTSLLDFDDLQGERRFNPLAAFGASKMANLIFTAELVRRLQGTGVTANAVHPGLIRSSLMADLPFPVRWVLWLISSRPPKAAAMIAELASAPDLTETSGVFFKAGKPTEFDAYSRAPEVGRRLWEVSLRLGEVV